MKQESGLTESSVLRRVLWKPKEFFASINKIIDLVGRLITRHFRPNWVHWNESIYCTPTYRPLKMGFNEGSASFLRPSIYELWKLF